MARASRSSPCPVWASSSWSSPTASRRPRPKHASAGPSPPCCAPVPIRSSWGAPTILSSCRSSNVSSPGTVSPQQPPVARRRPPRRAAARPVRPPCRARPPDRPLLSHLRRRGLPLAAGTESDGFARLILRSRFRVPEARKSENFCYLRSVKSSAIASAGAVTAGAPERSGIAGAPKPATAKSA